MTAPPPIPAFSDETADPVTRRRRDTIIRTIWSTRTDLQELGTHNPDRFQWWLLMHGEEEYKALAEKPLVVSPAWLREPAAEALPGVLPVLTRFMRFIWSMRPDLKSVYDLGDPAGQQGFVWWYFLQGAVDHRFGRFFTDEQKAFLNQPARISSVGTPVPLTHMMMHIHAGRPDLREVFPLATADGRESFVRWYFLNGVAELNLLDLVDEGQCAALRHPSPAAPGLPLLLYWIWQIDAGLRRRFADPQPEQLLSWARAEGVGHYPILGRVLSQPPQEQVATPATRQTPEQPSRPGVNLIGYARGQFGIGEDVRMAALALRAAGISCSILDIAAGNGASQGDLSAAEFITEGLPHTVNMLCMTGMDMARLQATEGDTLLTGRPVIGYWPWELPAWPVEWHHAYDMVDEVWASSRYTYNAYIQDSPKPVRHMPMAVATDATANLRQAQLGLPEQKLLFLFIFDSLSMLARKNPLACVRAFKAAFPAGSEPVGLVLKTMRATMAAQEWALIDAEIGDDPRITIIRQTLDRGAVLDLFRACDIFVSLHRAEGFGRAIAEAMMLGLPVITTGFSGNLDFTTPGTAALVDYRMRPVQEGEYPFGVGQVWAEPDIDHAAWWMRRLAGDTVARRRLARAGQQLVRDSYSPQAVGQHYRAVLAPFGI